MRLKTVIVDDEPIAREGLRMLLMPDEEIEVVAECRNGREAVRLLRTQNIDLLFLDIRMPGKDGFEVLREVEPQRMPLVIFVTAYEDYAVQAFEICAVDYLVKAVNPDRLRSAVQRAKEKIKAQDALNSKDRLESVLRTLEMLEKPVSPYVQRFLARNGDSDTIISADDVSWIEAADYYACLHVGEKIHMIRESIKTLETRLDPHKFIRLHRSAIVNIGFVKELKRDGRSEGWAVLSTGERVRMNRTGWQRFVAVQSTI
jgi:two-component system LytT family response regulator